MVQSVKVFQWNGYSIEVLYESDGYDTSNHNIISNVNTMKIRANTCSSGRWRRASNVEKIIYKLNVINNMCFLLCCCTLLLPNTV